MDCAENLKDHGRIEPYWNWEVTTGLDHAENVILVGLEHIKIGRDSRIKTYRGVKSSRRVEPYQNQKGKTIPKK